MFRNCQLIVVNKNVFPTKRPCSFLAFTNVYRCSGDCLHLISFLSQKFLFFEICVLNLNRPITFSAWRRSFLIASWNTVQISLFAVKKLTRRNHGTWRWASKKNEQKSRHFISPQICHCHFCILMPVMYSLIIDFPLWPKQNSLPLWIFFPSHSSFCCHDQKLTVPVSLKF